jgi:VWFA-related protein
MRTASFLALITLGGLSAAAIAAGQSAQPGAAAPAAQQAPPGQSGYVLKVRTRLVTLDVIAVDSQGNPVRDLKPEELQVFEERNKQQTIATFEFVDTAAKAAAPKARPPQLSSGANFYSNAVGIEGLRIPPTVLLLDALNSTTINQQRARAHLIELLRTLPQDTPVAVFLLSSTPRLLQGFTTDPALLRRATERALGLNPTRIERNPQDDPDSTAQLVTGLDDAPEFIQVVEFIRDFSKERYADSIDLRARVTLETLTSIARSLSGIRGRKNLIWLSESFPFSISPEVDFGSNVFAGLRNYEDRMKAAANLLTDAQVALYPVDLRGLETQQSLAASQRVAVTRGAPDSGIGGLLGREQQDRIQAQMTMDSLAADTGGRTCKNGNDLSGCVATALQDGATYYEVGFYPENIKWDGKYHSVTVKTTRRGVSLNYRRSYFAVDTDSMAKSLSPEDQLRQACSDLLPSTAIHLAAQAVPPEPTGPGGGPVSPRYLFLIAPGGLSRVQIGSASGINAMAATCEFDATGSSYRFVTQTLTGTASEDFLQKWQTEGMPDFVNLSAATTPRRVRFAVVDVPTGLTGAVDILVRPEDADLRPAPPPPPVVISAVLSIPDRYAPGQPWQPRATGALTFGGPSGQSGSLDWNGDVLLYRGDLPMEQSAPAFFSYAFGARFACSEGRLAPKDPAGGEATLRFVVGNHDGKIATVDLKGAQPEYSGDLPVDATARTFFDRVWRLSHCQPQ